jgi:uncharacterized protein (TIGR02246 family)
MTARTPADLHEIWPRLFNAGDLDGLMTLYEPDAVVMPQPGQTVSGYAAIREAFAGFLALKPKFTLQFQTALECGDLALVFSRWTLEGTAPDGSAISLAGQTSDVVRRQPGGQWLFAIDNPFGGAGADAVTA